MKDPNFIDEALKEHARHQGKPDQDFLDQLEAKMDEASDLECEMPMSREENSTSRAAWMSVAALIVVALIIGAVFRLGSDLKSNDLSEPIVVNGGSSFFVPIEEPAEPPLATQVERKGARPAASTASLTSNFASHDPRVSVPESFGVVPGSAMDGVFDESDFGAGWGDGDGWSGGGFGFNAVPQESGNRYGGLVEQEFLSPLSAPLSTFSIDVDTASYTNIRKHILEGTAINPNAVRIEEMINYFDYRYEEPRDDHPFSVQMEVADCPWNTKHRLVKIGLKGKEVKEDRKAANLVFLIDVSGSMSSSDKLPLLVKSFEILLKSLNERDRVSLVVYAGREEVVLRPTAINDAGRKAVSAALKKLSAGGSTNGESGIATAYDLARSGFLKGGVNRVVLATDGDFNVGTTNQDELLKLVKNQAEGEISLTILGFGQGNLNDELMEQLSNNGDGNYFYLDSLREGQKVFQHDLTGTIETIAKDVKIQVEFNPGKVARYRLLGYANRRLKDEDFTNHQVDAGDVGGGHNVTALYELIPVGADSAPLAPGLKYQKVEEAEPPRKLVDSPESLTVKSRYKMSDGDVSSEISKSLIDEGRSLQEATADFRFASAVAMWGLFLSDSEYLGNGTVPLLEDLALDAIGEDLQGERAECLDLIRKWAAGL